MLSRSTTLTTFGFTASHLNRSNALAGKNTTVCRPFDCGVIAFFSHQTVCADTTLSEKRFTSRSMALAHSLVWCLSLLPKCLSIPVYGTPEPFDAKTGFFSQCLDALSSRHYHALSPGSDMGDCETALFKQTVRVEQNRCRQQSDLTRWRRDGTWWTHCNITAVFRGMRETTTEALETFSGQTVILTIAVIVFVAGFLFCTPKMAKHTQQFFKTLTPLLGLGNVSLWMKVLVSHSLLWNLPRICLFLVCPKFRPCFFQICRRSHGLLCICVGCWIFKFPDTRRFRDSRRTVGATLGKLYAYTTSHSHRITLPRLDAFGGDSFGSSCSFPQQGRNREPHSEHNTPHKMTRTTQKCSPLTRNNLFIDENV